MSALLIPGVGLVAHGKRRLLAGGAMVQGIFQGTGTLSLPLLTAAGVARRVIYTARVQRNMWGPFIS